MPHSSRTSFKPGVSGNPGGRPKYAGISKAMREFAESKALTRKPKTVAERLARAAILRAIGKSDRALETVLDRTEGSVPRDITSGGEPLIPDAALLALLAKAKL
jgi:hypothetical protein